MDNVNIQYIFTFPDDSQEYFSLQMNPETLELTHSEQVDLPPWALLSFCQCPNCTFTELSHRHCPVAANLVSVINCVGRVVSYHTIHVDVITNERYISRATSAQKGVSSLMGLIMAVSGCPHMAFLKPMARFHLPFATSEETIFRAVSMYLLAQNYRRKLGHNPDLDLTGLVRIYDNIQTVNASIAERLRAASQTDSAVNALVLLDNHAKFLSDVLDESLEDIGYLFAPFLTEGVV